MRYVVSKSRQIWHTFPLFVLLDELRRDGISGVREHARARREYAALFPGNLLRADRFAPVELLVRQANNQTCRAQDQHRGASVQHPAGFTWTRCWIPW